MQEQKKAYATHQKCVNHLHISLSIYNIKQQLVHKEDTAGIMVYKQDTLLMI